MPIVDYTTHCGGLTSVVSVPVGVPYFKKFRSTKSMFADMFKALRMDHIKYQIKQKEIELTENDDLGDVNVCNKSLLSSYLKRDVDNERTIIMENHPETCLFPDIDITNRVLHSMESMEDEKRDAESMAVIVDKMDVASSNNADEHIIIRKSQSTPGTLAKNVRIVNVNEVLVSPDKAMDIDDDDVVENLDAAGKILSDVGGEDSKLDEDERTDSLSIYSGSLVESSSSAYDPKVDFNLPSCPTPNKILLRKKKKKQKGRGKISESVNNKGRSTESKNRNYRNQNEKGIDTVVYSNKENIRSDNNNEGNSKKKSDKEEMDEDDNENSKQNAEQKAADIDTVYGGDSAKVASKYGNVSKNGGKMLKVPKHSVIDTCMFVPSFRVPVVKFMDQTSMNCFCEDEVLWECETDPKRRAAVMVCLVDILTYICYSIIDH